MDAALAIVSKRDVRGYKQAPLPETALTGILQAGRVAGNAMNRQERRFVVLRDRQGEAASLVTRPGNVEGAALVIAIVTSHSKFADFDAGRAAQNMMLWAWNEGIASCPNAVADADGLRDLLGLSSDEGVAVLLSFGLPVTSPDPARRTFDDWAGAADRVSLEDLVDYR